MTSTKGEGVDGRAGDEAEPGQVALRLRDLAVSPAAIAASLVLHGLVWMLVRATPMAWLNPSPSHVPWVAREGGVFGSATAAFVVGLALVMGSIHWAGRGRAVTLLSLVSAGTCILGHGLAFVVFRSCVKHGYQPGTLGELVPALASFSIAATTGLVAVVGSFVRRSRRGGRCLAFCASVDSAVWLVFLHVFVVSPILRPREWTDPVPPESGLAIEPWDEPNFTAELRFDGSLVLRDPTNGRTHRPATRAELRDAAVEIAGSMHWKLDEAIGRELPDQHVLILADQGAPYRRLEELLLAHADGAEIWRYGLVLRTSRPPWSGNLLAYVPIRDSSEPLRLEVGVRVEGSRLHPTLDRPWNGDGPFRCGPDRELDIRIDGEVVETTAEVERLLIGASESKLVLSVRADEGVVVGDVTPLLELYGRGNGIAVALSL